MTARDEPVRPMAYSYVRFSTPEQAHGDSLRRQSEAAKDYAAKHGLELDETLTFRDLGTSAFRGLNIGAGKLGAFLDAVSNGLIVSGSYLLVESLDRISRENIRKAVATMELIVGAGINLVDLSDGEKLYLTGYATHALERLTMLVLPVAHRLAGGLILAAAVVLAVRVLTSTRREPSAVSSHTRSCSPRGAASSRRATRRRGSCFGCRTPSRARSCARPTRSTGSVCSRSR